MYKISNIAIDNFWENYHVDMKFDEEVNILIGKNGSGKTTFMNLLHAVLTIDIDKLAEITFSNVIIKLNNKNSRKTVKITKIEDFHSAPIVRYQISKKKSIELPIITNDSLRMYPLSLRRKMKDSYDQLKNEFQEFVSVSSLSVYRNNYEYDFDHREYRDKRDRYFFSPVDERLNNLLEKLTRYQLQLSSQAREISTQLQKDVLLSLLDKDQKRSWSIDFINKFDSNQQKENLSNAYNRLGLVSKEVENKITNHINSMEKLKEQLNKGRDSIEIDFYALHVQNRIEKIIDLSLLAEKNTDELFKQLNLYLSELKRFMDKNFIFSKSGDLEIDGKGYPIDKLSSGEKQLLILLTEALLQNKESFIFLADEPELSLHIEWQREILPAVRRINPNAQVIVATHSPEIAGKYNDNIIQIKKSLFPMK
ncbi:MAG: AAA family ATPase [Moraxella sp.]